MKVNVCNILNSENKVATQTLQEGGGERKFWFKMTEKRSETGILFSWQRIMVRWGNS